MGTQVKDIFSVYTSTIYELLQGRGGVGYYIPLYQRPYAWEKDSLHALINDTIYGINNLTKRNDTCTFIGSIITMEAPNREIIKDASDEQWLPSDPRYVIDGQQRLTTVVLISTVLLDFIYDLQKKILTTSRNQDILNLLSDVSQDLEDCIFESTKYRKFGLHGKLPKVIRGDGKSPDRWLMNEESYTSPIGRFLKHFAMHQDSYPNPEIYETFDYKINNNVENNEQHLKLQKNVDLIYTHLENLLLKNKSNDDVVEMPNSISLFSNSIISTELFGLIDIAETYPIFAKHINDENFEFHEITKQVFRLLCYVKYHMNKVAVSHINAKNEDYAFDIFDSLNTTGEPLNAIETFKPNVVKRYGISEWQNSSPKQDFLIIQNYIDNITDIKSKDRIIKDILTNYHYSRNGFLLKNHIKNFRDFLNNTYSNLAFNDQEQFVKNLRISIDFDKYLWNGDLNYYYKDKLISDDNIKLCLKYLRDMKHTMPTGILLRFYEKVHESIGDPNHEDSINNLNDAIKSTTAFYILFRYSRKTTGGIDSKYRDILSGNNSDVTGLEKGFCFSKSKDLQDVGLLKEAYKNILIETEDNLLVEENWVKKFIQIDIYKSTAKNTAKFLLLMSHHNTIVEKGLLKKSKQGYRELFNYENYSQQDITVEHIAPQNPAEENNYDENIYHPYTFTNTIGNLTLLPASENSSISNREWKEKQLFYKTLSATDENTQKEILNKGKNDGIKFSNGTISLLKNSKYNTIIEGLGDIEEFNKEFLIKRSENIGAEIFKSLIKWLD